MEIVPTIIRDISSILSILFYQRYLKGIVVQTVPTILTLDTQIKNNGIVAWRSFYDTPLFHNDIESIANILNDAAD
ncbi:MAG: hypothetical protein KKC68_06525, partial [Candidatus Thermoplasmatota archaeon]|nr:hypothetical protein [Candidatus Thermoplasmatota archaeon]